ncbi:MAG: OmpA family protein [Syntrophobacteraceae bacterium]
MRKAWPLWALICFLPLGGCGTVGTSSGTSPITCGVNGSQGTKCDLSTDLVRLLGAQVTKQKGSIYVTIPSDSLFQPDGDKMKISDMADMDALANAGKKYPHMNIKVKVYTDCAHSETRDLILTELEAWLIKRALVDRGIPAGRISAQGWGEARPVASNATANGRKANRRVLIIFEPGAS